MMERLTNHEMDSYNELGCDLCSAYCYEMCKQDDAVKDCAKRLRNIRLAAYEDTGLTPEEVRQVCMAAKHMMFDDMGDFVRYSIANFEKLQEYKSIGTPEQFADWKKADEEGRLVVLPCKVGEEVWLIVDDIRYKCEYCDMYFPDAPAYIGCIKPAGNKCPGGIIPVYFDMSMLPNVGKTVFLTREAAQAALEAQEERNK